MQAIRSAIRPVTSAAKPHDILVVAKRKFTFVCARKTPVVLRYARQIMRVGLLASDDIDRVNA